MPRPLGSALVAALLFDLLLGEPVNTYHPVAWMGRAIATLRAHAPQRGRLLPLLYGAMLAMGGVVTIAVPSAWVERRLRYLGIPWRWLLIGYLLKMTFSVRGLAQAGRAVESALASGDLDQARHWLAWHLVSRDTSQLSQAEVAAAAIESIAENTSDGIVAPLFYYAVGGLPAALAYRYLNTLDAMVGYRGQNYEWLGKVPARLDDLANLMPARITAALLVMAAQFGGEDAGQARHIWRRDASQTASPNAGHSMSAMAGALRVTLAKAGHYCLGAGQRDPESNDISRALRLMFMATALAAAGATLLIGLRATGQTQ